MNPELPDTSYQEFFLWLIGKRQRFRVTGKSMEPLLKPGEEVLINPYVYQRLIPEVNDIVVATHPDQPKLKMVKRIIEIRQDRSYFLQGDNLLASTDSRDFGAVPLKFIRGKVTSRFV